MPDNNIKNWPKDQRPRERLLREGEHHLSDAELLAILLRTGTKGQSALELAGKILAEFGSFSRMSHTDPGQWRKFKGVGQAKLAQIKSALEIGRRFREQQAKDARAKITSSAIAARILSPRLRDLKKEVFFVLLLNSQNCLIDIVEVTQGTVNQAAPIVREVFHKALENFAASIICVHNHPSAVSEPSAEDAAFTRALSAAGQTLQVKVLDHIIIAGNGYFSFADSGRM